MCGEEYQKDFHVFKSVSRLVRAFQAIVVCGKASDVTVKESYLSNAELRRELTSLEQRVSMQNRRFDESPDMKNRMMKMAKAAIVSDEQFRRLGDMVDALQKNRKIDRCDELK